MFLKGNQQPEHIVRIENVIMFLKDKHQVKLNLSVILLDMIFSLFSIWALCNNLVYTDPVT